MSESDPSLKDPSSLSAIRRIKELSNDALRAYIKGTEEHGVRFLRYPVDITKDGIIQAHPDMPNILDFENIKIEDILHQTPIEEYM